MERQHAETHVYLIFPLRCDIRYVVGDITSIRIFYVSNCEMFDSSCVVCECIVYHQVAILGVIRAD
jgi:hypothetical protein